MAESCLMCPVRKQTETKKEKVIKEAKKRTAVVGLDEKAFAVCKAHQSDPATSITLKQTEEKFKADHPSWKEEKIAVPITNIKTAKFPANKTLEDATEYFRNKFKELKEEKKEEIKNIREDIKNAIDLKEDHINLPLIVSEKVVDKMVRKGVQNEDKAKKTITAEIKRNVKNILENNSDEDMLCEEIHKSIVQILMRGLENELTSSKDYGRMILRKGEEAELHVKEKIEGAIGSSPALIIMGFKVWAYTHEALQKIGVNLKTASKKSEVEHDIMIVTSTEEFLEVKFVQVKDPDIRPWLEDAGIEESMEDKEKNFKKLATKALEQTIKDVTVFMEMFPDISEEDLKKIKFSCLAALPFSEGVNLCENCNAKILTKDVFNIQTKLRSYLNLPDKEILNDCVQDLYVKIGSRYIGLGSIVPLKTLGEFYKESMKQMDDVKTAHERALRSSSADQTGVELALQLSDDQIRITHHHGSMIVIGPHGSGKSIMLLLAVSRRIKELRARQYQVRITVHLIIWEHSNKLKEMFTDFSEQFEDDVDTNINIYFKKEVLQQFGTHDDGDNRIKTLNNLMKKLENDDEEVIVAIDEMTQLPSPINNGPFYLTDAMLYIQSLFLNRLNTNLGDWSRLDPGSLTLLLSLQPVMSIREKALPPVTSIIGPSTMEVYKLSSVYRNTWAIHNLLNQLNKERVPSVKEAWVRFCRGGAFNNEQNPSCVMDPAEETRGHGVEGAKPQWIVVPRCSHMVCIDSVGCFLKKNWERIGSQLDELHQQFGKKNVAVIVDIGNDNDREGVDWIKQKTGKGKVYNVEDFIGGETQALAFIQRGEYDNPAKYNGWSRGTSHLCIITDNTQNNTFWSLQAAAREGVLTVLQPTEIPTTNPASYSTLCSIFGQNDWNVFIFTMLCLLPRLLLNLVPLMVASLLHRTGRTQYIKRLTDNTWGLYRMLLELVLTLVLLLSFMAYNGSWSLVKVVLIIVFFLVEFILFVIIVVIPIIFIGFIFVICFLFVIWTFINVSQYFCHRHAENESVQTDTSILDVTVEDLDLDMSLISTILQEEKDARKSPPAKPNYKESLDICITKAAILNQYEKARFDKFLNATNYFLNLVRRGVDYDLTHYISNPAEYSIVPQGHNHNEQMKKPTEAAVVARPNDETKITIDPIASSTSSVIEMPSASAVEYSVSSSSQSNPNLREIPDHHKHFFDFDGMILGVLGDGSCLYRSIAASVYGDEERYFQIRKDANDFLENCFDDFYIEKIVFPVNLTVHGQEEKEVCSDRDEFFRFLKTERGYTYRSYGDSELEVQNLCNLLNININILSYTRDDSRDPIWNKPFQPDQSVVPKSQYASRDPCQVILYHEGDVHYELVITRPPGVVTQVLEQDSGQVDERSREGHFEKMLRILLQNVSEYISEEDNFVQRAGVHLLRNLAYQMDGQQKILVGNLGVVEKMLNIITKKLHASICDDVMEAAWSTMWSVIDETPVNCERFVNGSGMYLFIKCKEQFPGKVNLNLNMMGPIGNVAEVPELRHNLMAKEFIEDLSFLLDSDSDGIKIQCSKMEGDAQQQQLRYRQHESIQDQKIGPGQVVRFNVLRRKEEWKGKDDAIRLESDF